MKNNSPVLAKPQLTEKASLLQESQGKVVFKVHPEANKIDIKNAIEKMFNVKVKEVKTLNFLGKEKRVGQKKGKTQDWKKAYVSLSEGAINFSEEL